MVATHVKLSNTATEQEVGIIFVDKFFVKLFL
jgi:hypothetical protein